MKNKTVGIIKRMFKWGASMELLPVAIIMLVLVAGIVVPYLVWNRRQETPA